MSIKFLAFLAGFGLIILSVVIFLYNIGDDDNQSAGAIVCFPYQGCTGTSTVPIDSQILIGRPNSVYKAKTLIAGSNITFTSTTDTLTVASTGGSGGSNWQFIGPNAIRPTTTVGIIVNASSTFDGDLNLGTNQFVLGNSPNLMYISYEAPERIAITGSADSAVLDVSLLTAGDNRTFFFPETSELTSTFLMATGTQKIVTSGGIISQAASSTFAGYLTAEGGFTGNASTADALKANPTDCSANQFANTIAASGNLTCAAIADADVPDTITASNYLLRSSWFSTTTPYWQFIGDNAIRPTTTVGIIVNASSTFTTDVEFGHDLNILANGQVNLSTTDNSTQSLIYNSGTDVSNSNLTFNASGVTDMTINNSGRVDIAGGGLISQASSTFTGDLTAGNTTSSTLYTTGIIDSDGGFRTSASSTMGATSFEGAVTGVSLSEIEDLTGNKTFNAGTNTLTWQSTNPAGGYLYNLTGAGSAHFFEVRQETGNPGANTHLAHVQAEDNDILPFHIVHTGTPTLGYFQISSAAPTPAVGDVFIVDSNKRVGIGNSGPTSKLTVNGGDFAISSAGSATTTISSGVSYLAGGLVSQASSTISNSLAVGTADQLTINSTGNITKINNITYSWPSSQGGASTFLQNNGAGTLTWASASGGSNWGWYDTDTIRPSTTDGTVGLIVQASSTFIGDFTAGSGTSPKLFVDADGNVGISTSTPTALFSVEGPVYTSATTTVTGLVVRGNTPTSTVTCGTDTKPCCWKSMDSDLGGYSYFRTLNGVITADQNSCE